MKPRTPLPPRKSYLKRSTKPIPRVNLKAQAKRKSAYRKYLASALWKRLRNAAIERAGNRCEGSVGTVRCPKTARLTVHHITYARYGGKELPEDLMALCKDCHRRLHALQGKRIA